MSQAIKIIGKPRFLLQPVLRIPPAPFYTGTGCLICGEITNVERGRVMAVFRVGSEIVGIVCDECLDDETRIRLGRLRAAGEQRAVSR